MSVVALAKSEAHEFSKTAVASLNLITGIGVEGDCHQGKLVQHLSRVKLIPRRPNLRQVHLIPREILDSVDVRAGQIGENITTINLDLLSLGRGTKLHFLPDTAEAQTESHAIVVVEGLRNPCPQIDKFQPGLKEKFIIRDAERKIVGRKAGIMGTVEVGGPVSVGMRIVVEPTQVYEQLECV